MQATIDYRWAMRRGGATVTLKMTLDELRETVEWLEVLDPQDGCTKDWRAHLDRLDPPGSDDDD